MKSSARNSSEEILQEHKLNKQRSGEDVHFHKRIKKEGRDSRSEGEEEGERNNSTAVKNVSHGFHLVKGKMDHGMEDFIVTETRKTDGHDLGLYAIFDGHSGREVAKYLQAHLFNNILSQIDFWTSPEKAVRRAYRKTDKEILERVVGSRGGSTAVTAILIDRKKLFMANVGDSRAVIYRGGRASQITVDHDPKKEKELVESRGGLVIKMRGNVPRVDGQLAMSRAFGDKKVKEHITSDPDIEIETVDEKTKFVILGSDGLWKVMSNSEACDCVRNTKDAQEAAEKLVAESVSRNSRDDISCIVVMFR